MATLQELKIRSAKEQFDEDTKQWCNFLEKPGLDTLAAKCKDITVRVFYVLAKGGLVYRENAANNGSCEDGKNKQYWEGWQYWCESNIPVAAALSHGGRVMIQTPKGDGSKFWDWLTGGSVNVQPVSKNLSGLTGSASKSKPIYGRVSTHGIVSDSKKPKAYGSFKKEIAEIKVEGVSHVVHLGHHYGMDVAIGGAGNKNFVSGNIIKRNGEHGHMYFYHQEASSSNCGGILIGCEGSAPKKDDQFGGSHGADGASGEFSPTGGLKWRDLAVGPGCRYADGTLYLEGNIRTKTKKNLLGKTKTKEVSPPAADTLMIILPTDWKNYFKLEEAFKKCGGDKMKEIMIVSFVNSISCIPPWKK